MAVTYHAARRIQGLSTDYNTTPTETNDFSTTATESKSGSSISIHGGVLGGDYVPTGSSQCSTVDPLGTTLSNTSWVARFKLTINAITNPSSETNLASIGFFATNGASGSGNEDSIIIAFWNNSSGSKQIRLGYTNNSFPASLTDKVTFTKQMAVETLYIELVRISDTSCKASLYSDSGYSSLIESQTLSISAGVCTNLRYFGGKNWNRSALNGVHDIDVDDLYIWNNTSTSPLLPKSALFDVQVGSRFEETDTRKMYNFVVPSLTFEEDWTSTPSGQTIVGSQVTESSNRINFAFTLNNVANSYSLDLANVSNMGANLDDEKFVVRFKMFIQDITSNATGQFVIMLSDTANAQPAVTSQNSLGFYTDGRSSDDEIFPAEYTGTSITLGSEIESVNGTGINLTRYVEFKRESQTVFRVTFYSDSSYSTVVGSQTVTAKTTHDALRYFSIGIRQVSGKVGDFEGYIDDLKVYNGVAQTTNHWQEIGT